MSETESMLNRPVCLLDASIYIFRYYFSLPDNWFSQEGYPSAAVYGYTQFLLSFLQQQRPTSMAACFDESLGSCFRNQLYEGYKSSRALPDEDLAFQLKACREITELLGITCYSGDIYEADDYLGTLAAYLHTSGDHRSVAILTRDKDLGQLLTRSQDYLWDYTNKDQQVRLFRDDIYQKFGVWPEQLVDYLALVGDSIDDIPGVPGIGQKTAQALLQWGGSIEGVFARIDELPKLKLRGAKSLPAKLCEYTEQIALSRSLAQIVTDIDEVDGIDGLGINTPCRDRFEGFIARMGFAKVMMKKFDTMMEAV